MKFRLVESYLIEDIESMKKYYKNIPDALFLKLAQYDPTFNERRQNGTYLRWIYKLADKGNGTILNIGHLKDVLTRFHQDKSELKNTDILKFDSVDDLEDYLNDESSYKETSYEHKRLKNKLARRDTDLQKDAKLVFDGKDWEVWNPLTYAASCQLGKGTKWCTANVNSDKYYNGYTELGPLYIIISKKDKYEKYQVHFESKSFMDKDDEYASSELFFDNPELVKLFSKRKISKLIGVDFDKAQETIQKLKDNDGVFVFDSKGHSIPDVYIPYVKEVIFDSNIKEIPDYALDSMSSVHKVTIHNGITRIGLSAFRDCPSLTTIDIPDSVTYIGPSAFGGCTKLLNIHIPNGIREINYLTFNDCASLQSVYIPNGVEYIDNMAFIDCCSLMSIDIPDSVASIGQSAFRGCNKLKTVKLPNELRRIENGAFKDCTSITRIDIPDKVETIGRYVFEECTSLQTVRIPDSVRTISKNTFHGCRSDLTIACNRGSVADQYAQDEGIKVKYLN